MRPTPPAPEARSRLCQAMKTIPLAGALALLATPALAQGWEDPIIQFIELLNSGTGRIGGWVIGLGIIALGLWGGLTGRMDWNRFIIMLIGGLFVIVGPEIASSLFGSE